MTRTFSKQMAHPVNSKWRVAAVILTIVAMGQSIELFRIKSALKNLFRYDVKVTLKDKNTGAFLEGVTTHGPGTTSNDLFHQSTTFGSSMEGRQISGIAYEPRVFGFSAAGYKRKNIEVTDDTKCSITVELEPRNQTAIQSGTNQPTTAPKSKLGSAGQAEPESEGRSH